MNNVLYFVLNLNLLMFYIYIYIYIYVCVCVLYRYVQRGNLSELLNEAQDFEEHLITNMVFRMSLQRDVVICMEKVEITSVQDRQPDAERMEGSDAELVAVDSVDCRTTCRQR